MSSAMMTRMFGFCCWADAGGTVREASKASRPSQTVLIVLILNLLGVARCGMCAAQNRVMFAAGGFGDFMRLALYSSTAFSTGPITHSYIAPILCSSRGSDSMLKTLG